MWSIYYCTPLLIPLFLLVSLHLDIWNGKRNWLADDFHRDRDIIRRDLWVSVLLGGGGLSNACELKAYQHPPKKVINE
jgi:hypothetical protein